MIRIGNYHTNDPKVKIGEGSYSTVYEGYDLNNNLVAIKVVPKNNIKFITNEMNIMNIIKNINHDNIIKCYDVLENDKNLYIIMEYCNSGTLYDLLKKISLNSNKCMTEIYAKYYFLQIIEGIIFLRNNYIFHRDIKTKNILLQNNKIIKIADFGLAKIQEKHNSLSDTICGSPQYMAPELIYNYINKDKSIKYNESVDIWSLGIILYELIFGNSPYTPNVNSINDIHNILTQDNIYIPKFNKQNIKISDDCLSLLKSMLQIDPLKRITFDNIKYHPWIVNKGYIIESDILSYPIIHNFKKIEIDKNYIDNFTNNSLDDNSIFNFEHQ